MEEKEVLVGYEIQKSGGHLPYRRQKRRRNSISLQMYSWSKWMEEAKKRILRKEEGEKQFWQKLWHKGIMKSSQKIIKIK